MVFVLDKHQKPLMPCTEKRARLLLQHDRAVVVRIAPFTIRLKDRTVEESILQPLRLKFDPGSKTTGFTVLREVDPDDAVSIILGEIHHKPGIEQNLDSRRALRRGRRNRKTRYLGGPRSRSFIRALRLQARNRQACLPGHQP